MFLIHIDVNESLSKLIPINISITLNDLIKLDSSINNLNIPSLSCNNEMNLIELNLNRFVNLESIVIGNDCFGTVQTLRIEGLNRLQTIKIGHNSFTQVKSNDFDNDLLGSLSKCRNESKSFHILNCESLKVIEIGQCSFCDFGGEFELRNLENLELIKIGKIGNASMNFYSNSFNIRGNTKINENIKLIDLPNLKSIELGNVAFGESLSTIIESMF